MLLGLLLALSIQVPPHELCAGAERVVVAEVTDLESRFRADGTIETEAHLAVIQEVKGKGPDSASVVYLGGATAGMRWVVSEMPVLQPDHRYLLYIKGDRLVADAQGVIPLSHDPAETAATLATLECR